MSIRERVRRKRQPSYAQLQAERLREDLPDVQHHVSVHCGWGRLLFGHTFPDEQSLAQALLEEGQGERDIAFYVARPQVVVSLAPQRLFLDPSDSYRLWLNEYQPRRDSVTGVNVRRISTEEDVQAVNAIYLKCRMQPLDPQVVLGQRRSRARVFLLAEDQDSGQVLGAVLGLDHQRLFADPERGASLWSLAVAPDASRPRVGEALVRYLAERMHTRGCHYLDLSVLHSNDSAKQLYEKLGFRLFQTFAVKRRNAINEALYTEPQADEGLNPYARIIVDEARSRGIQVEIEDSEANIFTLALGGSRIRCHESLTDLTPATAMTLCQNKWLTHRCLDRAGLPVPKAELWQAGMDYQVLLQRCNGRVVVKPIDSEQGKGIAVDVRSPEALEQAVAQARQISAQVLLEPYYPGDDVRVLVINDEVVAAAVRRPATVVGDGKSTLEQLIHHYSRRRAAATGGESRIPLDQETLRTIRDAGYGRESVLPAGERLAVRKTANLHTGGTLEDVTDQLHPQLAQAAIEAARALNIPVTGIDMLVPDVTAPHFVIIEANERPGLANHEPHPTAERFIDLLFPTTIRSRL
ncbi:N-acetylglutaminylglutamine synthetase [Balneatrix alpica]|uniref:N-acetylglutaminylglutamine synthetase n=1 Tax=Balneatrix alpica TaxID=75684 RepID=UPI00273832D4|nr:N-acetylglutaminylglutamine synthetase [Balneatrix alpica]